MTQLEQEKARLEQRLLTSQTLLEQQVASNKRQVKKTLQRNLFTFTACLHPVTFHYSILLPKVAHYFIDKKVIDLFTLSCVSFDILHYDCCTLVLTWSKLGWQLEATSRTDQLVKDLYVENSNLVKCLELTEKRSVNAEKNIYNIEEKYHVLRGVLGSVGHSMSQV